jgi:hypothetical protein
MEGAKARAGSGAGVKPRLDLHLPRKKERDKALIML